MWTSCFHVINNVDLSGQNFSLQAKSQEYASKEKVQYGMF